MTTEHSVRNPSLVPLFNPEQQNEGGFLMEAKVVGFKTKTVTKTVTSKVPREVQLTMPFEVFVALTSLWSRSFDGWDKEGLRDQVDSSMRSAWVEVTGRSPLGYEDLGGYGARANSATENAQAWIDKITEVLS